MTVNAPPELMMALNNLAERQIAASRQLAAFGTGALDTKRHERAYCEYGFPDNPGFSEPDCTVNSGGIRCVLVRRLT